MGRPCGGQWWQRWITHGQTLWRTMAEEVDHRQTLWRTIAEEVDYGQTFVDYSPTLLLMLCSLLPLH